MRDLAAFVPASFDIVWHAHSINFIPDVRPVFQEVARVLRAGGLYRVETQNPFYSGLSEQDRSGSGYLLSRPYTDGELTFDDPHWSFLDETSTVRRVVGPREFCHTLSTLVNTLIVHGFVLLGIWEELIGDPTAGPGTWEHLTAIAPPWLTFWSAYRPA
jgi:SAM-dependent methyltransferase